MDAQQDPLYTVALRGAPEIFSAQRVRLQASLQLLLDRAYGGHRAAANALRAGADGLGAAPGEARWSDALEDAVQRLGVQLPPGARFECELTPEPVSRVT